MSVQLLPASTRVKVLWLTPEILVDVLFSPSREGGEIRCISQEGIPDGAKIEAVCFSFEQRAFGLRFSHPSFEEVEPGNLAPGLKVRLTAEKLHVLEDAEAICRQAAARMREECAGTLELAAKVCEDNVESERDRTLMVKLLREEAKLVRDLPLTDAEAVERYKEKPEPQPVRWREFL